MIQRFFLLIIVTFSCQAAEKRKSLDCPEEPFSKRTDNKTDNKQEYYNTSGAYVIDPNSSNGINPTQIHNYVPQSPTLAEKLHQFRLNNGKIEFDKSI